MSCPMWTLHHVLYSLQSASLRAVRPCGLLEHHIQALVLPFLQLRLSSNVILSHTEVAPTKRQGKFITYGAYSNTPAWLSSPFSVHFENNSPFVRATKLVRELEVSHWGNVYVDEKYYIRCAAIQLFAYDGVLAAQLCYECRFLLRRRSCCLWSFLSSSLWSPMRSTSGTSRLVILLDAQQQGNLTQGDVCACEQLIGPNLSPATSCKQIAVVTLMHTALHSVSAPHLKSYMCHCETKSLLLGCLRERQPVQTRGKSFARRVLRSGMTVQSTRASGHDLICSVTLGRLASLPCQRLLASYQLQHTPSTSEMRSETSPPPASGGSVYPSVVYSTK